jgi:hypothetical protein
MEESQKSVAAVAPNLNRGSQPFGTRRSSPPPSGDFRNSITQQTQPMNGGAISTPIRGLLHAGRRRRATSRRLVEAITVALYHHRRT